MVVPKDLLAVSVRVDWGLVEYVYIFIVFLLPVLSLSVSVAFSLASLTLDSEDSNGSKVQAVSFPRQ